MDGEGAWRGGPGPDGLRMREQEAVELGMGLRMGLGRRVGVRDELGWGEGCGRGWGLGMGWIGG